MTSSHCGFLHLHCFIHSTMCKEQHVHAHCMCTMTYGIKPCLGFFNDVDTSTASCLLLVQHSRPSHAWRVWMAPYS